MHLTEKNLMY